MNGFVQTVFCCSFDKIASTSTLILRSMKPIYQPTIILNMDIYLQKIKDDYWAVVWNKSIACPILANVFCFLFLYYIVYFNSYFCWMVNECISVCVCVLKLFVLIGLHVTALVGAWQNMFTCYGVYFINQQILGKGVTNTLRASVS